MIASFLSAIKSFARVGDDEQSLPDDSAGAAAARNAASHSHAIIKSSREHDAPCSELYDLVLEMRWHWALKHVEKHPQNACWQDGDSLETPLHLACQNRPPVRLVKALLKAYPDASITTSYKTRHLPLHFACRYNASIEVLRELLSSHPETATCASKYGLTPLHSLLEGRDTIANTEIEDYRTLFWQKVELLLRSIAMVRGDENFLLHAAVSIGSLNCPQPIIDFCLDRHGHLVQQADSTGRLPLHLAVGPALYSESSRRRYKPREQHVLHRLLELFPQAAQQGDPNEEWGRMPLHSALANGHVWYGGVKELFEAAPEIAVMPDPVTKLYPCQLSQDCDTIFKLLRSYPCVLRDKSHGASVSNDSASFQKARRRQTLSCSTTDKASFVLLGKESESDAHSSHGTNPCLIGTFVVGAAVGIVCRFLPFWGDSGQPPLLLEVSND